MRKFLQVRPKPPHFSFGILLAILVGLGGGLGSVAFIYLIRWIQTLFFVHGLQIFSFLGPFAVVPLPVIGGLLVGLIIYYGTSEARGHGVPEVMFAVTKRGGRMSPKTVIVKTLASALTIGSGGSVGRAGPVVQIGAAMGSTLGQFLKLPTAWLRTLVSCGAAAGISATFNAPLGGIFFTTELLTTSFMTYGLPFIMISSVTANVVTTMVLGIDGSFALPSLYSLVRVEEILFYIALGVIIVCVGFLFMKTLQLSENVFDAMKGIPVWFRPAIGGLAVGLMGLYSYDIFGVGYGEVPWNSSMSFEHVLAGGLPLRVLGVMALLKMVATSSSIGSGSSGGIFAPSLFIGGMTGGIVGYAAHYFIPAGDPGAFALVGAAAMFAGVTRAPFTSVIMMLELTRDLKMMVPLMLTVLIATEGIKLLSRETIYTEKLMRRGIDIVRLVNSRLVPSISVGDIMTRNPQTVGRSTTLSEMKDLCDDAHRRGFAVLDEDEKLYGIVTLTDYEKALEEGLDPRLTPVEAVCTTDLITAFPDETLMEVLPRVFDYQLGRIPVVDPEDPGKLLGMLRDRNIYNAWKLAFHQGEKSILTHAQEQTDATKEHSSRRASHKKNRDHPPDHPSP
ncbi:MAG TPA: chloride channel protein [Clostridia bacterium]|nr:chloride channel protein [Clostridia bacterium]